MRFRFAEKRKPDDYAVWVTEHMVWPVPPELVLSAPQLTWEWDKDGLGEKEVRDVLEGLRVDQGRAVLMARAEEHAKVCGPSLQWETEPWYGTAYRVDRLDEEFIKQVRHPSSRRSTQGLTRDYRHIVQMIFLNCICPDQTSSLLPI